MGRYRGGEDELQGFDIKEVRSLLDEREESARDAGYEPENPEDQDLDYDQEFDRYEQEFEDRYSRIPFKGTGPMPRTVGNEASTEWIRSDTVVQYESGEELTVLHNGKEVTPQEEDGYLNPR